MKQKIREPWSIVVSEFYERYCISYAKEVINSVNKEMAWDMDKECLIKDK
jgi:hypothetical protein